MAATRKVSKAKGSILTVKERRDLEFQTRFDRRTILRWERGDDLMDRTKRALDAAARKMGLPVPEVTHAP
jgi:hypothetical protein